ncbi:PRC-barrel domain-containing protein [Microbispora triticiradicis]|uniref:PRC-barrel domain-containing protein n=1 Tax=Microbispora triticiradicis TaxID=2200763 RepID=UPI001AD759BF|nr:PRC-barrel domain-containing protein [Microbispora triticiradicis]MBO4271769.1 PRC-barrel domain containing protein [Microbispora triticiradicis]
MTPDLWSYPDTVYGAGGQMDIVGYDVQAVDGKIGSVDEATYEAGQSYIVVDTGPWIFGKKVMLPASVVKSMDRQDRKVFVTRTKQEIKNAPEYDEAAAMQPEYRERLADYYGRFPRSEAL